MSDLDAQISEQATEIVRIEQEVIPEQRDRASQAAANLYKMGESSSSIITMLFSSNSFADLLTQVKYLTVIQDANVRELEDLEQTRADLNEQMAELSAKRDQVNEQQQKAEQALASVSEAQAAMQARANSEDAAEAEAARQAAEAAAPPFSSRCSRRLGTPLRAARRLLAIRARRLLPSSSLSNRPLKSRRPSSPPSNLLSSSPPRRSLLSLQRKRSPRGLR